MNGMATRPKSVLLLQWTLGLVVLVEASFLAFSPPEIKAFHKAGMPTLVRLALAWGEIAGALLFLVARTTAVGGWILIAVFLAAAAVHALHGMLHVGMLLIYAAAAWVVITHRRARA